MVQDNIIFSGKTTGLALLFSAALLMLSACGDGQPDEADIQDALQIQAQSDLERIPAMFKGGKTPEVTIDDVKILNANSQDKAPCWDYVLQVVSTSKNIPFNQDGEKESRMEAVVCNSEDGEVYIKSSKRL